MNKDKNIVNWYILNKPIYKRLANKIESLLIEVFDMENISYHIITSRAKDINSVKMKASNSKYTDPINQIQDFAGIRIITYVEDEIEKVCSIIEEIFDVDADNSSNKSDDLGIDKVGYKSVHYIASLKNDRLKLPEYKQYLDKCFEIQVRTILQHAWAEIEHDRNYKFSGRLPDDINRRFKIVAGTLEMADREFNNISNEIDLISSNVKKATKSGKLDIPISSTTLVQFLNNRLNINGNIIPSDSSYIIDELHNYGIETLADLNKIIPKDIDELLNAELDENPNEIGLARTLMILNDYDKYFSQANINEFQIWRNEGEYKDANFVREYFEKYGVDWNKIEKKYGVKYTD